MAVFQAVRAFELFTGIAPDVERMKAAFAAFGEPAASGIAGDATGKDLESKQGGRT